MANIFSTINQNVSKFTSSLLGGQSKTTTPVLNMSKAVTTQAPPVKTQSSLDGIPQSRATPPKATVTPSAPAATSPTPKITSPAGQAFVASQAATPAAAPSAPTVTTTTTAPATTPIPKPEKTAKDKYLEYLNSSQVKAAAQNVTDLSKRTAEEIARTRKEEEKIMKNEIGALESGVEGRLTELARQSNKSLADIAIAKGYATEIYNQMLGAGATEYEANKAAEDSITEGNKPFELNGELYQKQADGSYKSVAGEKRIDTQVVEVNGSKVLIDSKTGQTIKNLGSSGGGGGYTVGANSPIIQTILGSGKFTKDQSAAIANAINNGEDPFTVVRNQAKNIMGQTLATALDKNEQTRDAMLQLEAGLNEFYNAGGSTNIFSGNFEKVMNKLGAVKDPRLVDLAVQIAASLQKYRNAISGTAYSEQEGKDIASIFPGITKGQILNNTIVKARLKTINSDIDSAYRNTLGSAYDTLKTSNPVAQQSQQTQQSEADAADVYELNGINYVKGADGKYYPQ